MTLLEEYEQLLQSIRALSAELPEYTSQKRMYSKTIADTQRAKTRLELEQKNKKETLIANRLAVLTETEYQQISELQMSVDRKLAELSAQYEKHKQYIQNKQYTDELSEQYHLQKRLEETLATYKLPETISSEMREIVSVHLQQENTYTYDNLQELIVTVQNTANKLNTNASDTERNDFLSRFVDFISWKSISSADWSNTTKLYAYLAYIIGCTLAVIYIPVLPISLVSLGLCLTYFSYSRSIRELLEYVTPFSALETGHAYLLSEISKTITKLRQADLAKVTKQFNIQCNSLQEQKQQLQEQFQAVPTKVQESFSVSDLQQMVEQEFQDKIKKLDDKIATAERNIHKVERFMQSNEARLPRLREKQQSMLLKIKDTYLNPTTPGTSKQLTKSFILGVDTEQGTLLEVRFDGKAMLIVYKGINCTVNKELISMMLMQMLASMSMTVLDIYLTDLVSAGTDYAVFFQKELTERMHLCATDEDVKRTVETLHNTMIMRRKEILTEAESLEEYNQNMLERNSLPREYIFLLLQDPSLKQIEDQKLQQLLSNGPTVGIIPIIFINHTYVNTLSSKHSDSEDRLITFFQTFKESSYIFDGATSDLSSCADLCDCIIDLIKKGKR